MTSVASFDDATTAGNYTLTHSNSMLGNWVDAFNSKFARLTDIARRQNFWASSVLLDGSFPAQVWDHTFRLYTEAGSLGEFYEKFLRLHDAIGSSPATLVINDGDTVNTVIGFGLCYLSGADLEVPENFLLHRAGFITVAFVGNTRPEVFDLP